MDIVKPSFWTTEPRQLGKIWGGRLFLADEDVKEEDIGLLRSFGHTVRVVERNRRIPDIKNLKLARETKAILITQDKDFGELIVRYKNPPPLGVIYNREQQTMLAPRVHWLSLWGGLEHYFVIFKGDKIRYRLVRQLHMRLVAPPERLPTEFPVGLRLAKAV